MADVIYGFSLPSQRPLACKKWVCVWIPFCVGLLLKCHFVLCDVKRRKRRKNGGGDHQGVTVTFALSNHTYNKMADNIFYSLLVF